MTKDVRGAGRARYAANKARHDQRTPLPPRGSAPVHEDHTEALSEAAGRPVQTCSSCGARYIYFPPCKCEREEPEDGDPR